MPRLRAVRTHAHQLYHTRYISSACPPGQVLDAAKRMADEAYAARLQELGLAPHDASQFEAYSSAVAAQVRIEI